MTPNVQVSLLRVLQEREITRLGESHARRVDVRFLAATHRALAREVEEGRFREDLLYRIRVAIIMVPPLRERLDDVPLGDIVRGEGLPHQIIAIAPGPVDGQSERGRIVDALRRANGNRAEAARLLGVSRTTLYRRIREYGIDGGEREKGST